MKRLAPTLLFVAFATVNFLGIFGAPTPAHAEEKALRVSNLPVDQVKEAIRQKGLHWEATTYDREFTLGLIPATPHGDLEATPSALQAAGLPTALDWRDNGGNYVSPPKEQGDCGSCCTFSAVGALESQYAITNRKPDVLLDLSEQTQVSCSTCSCGGCRMDTAAQILVSMGAPLEPCFPYVASKVPCSNACSGWQEGAYKISGYASVYRSVSALKEALQIGPVAASMDVFSDFMTYRSGVYEHATGYIFGGHAVLAVGYVDTPGLYGGGYFIVKNSWGTHWGEEGFFRIGYSQVPCMTESACFGYEAFRYTVEPSQPATVVFNLKLEGVPSSITRLDGIQVKIDGFSTTTSVTRQGSQFVGTVSPQLPSGSYTLRVKGPRYLSRTLPITLTSSGGTVTADFVTAQKTFLAGDLDPNHDNRIDISDVALLLKNHGLTTTAALAAADLNFDGRVNMFDAGYLLKNYGLLGED